MIKICPICKRKIIDKKHPNRIYCSEKCFRKASQTGINIKCLSCKKSFYIPRNLIGKKKYCCKKCYTALLKGKHFAPNTQFKKGHTTWNKGTKGVMKPNKGSFQPGEKHSLFKGDYKHQGYILLYRPNHPLCSRGGYVKRSRLVMEKHLGCYIPRKKPVHHINHIRDDDRVDNLMLLNNNAEHRRLHPHSLKTRKKQSLAKKEYFKTHSPWNKKHK